MDLRLLSMPIDVNGAPYPVKPGASAKLQASPSF
jgi:hypothetical protein